ncbi:MAG: sugar phosphate isomerase/epimerase [Clostridiales bacterium]|jgi:sugar phosphate isomerase/epimerase|nr:sugar phosphate isomerase/epimerase [Clostridiales bacterium]
MKLGVLTVPLYDRGVGDAFAWLKARGVETVELGSGGSPGTGHCNPAELLADGAKLSALKELLKKYELTVSALSLHSNHVHPDREIRETAARDFTASLRLAEKLGIDTVISFSGCPGDQPDAKYPNWVTCAWPTDYPKILEYQWNDVLIPFWKEAAKEAAGYGVTKIALELHPGFCVYNTATLLRLREAVGPAIGANLDPSHLFWQGMNPAEAIKALKGAIYHFHAKDTKIDAAKTSVNGVLDTASLGSLADRSWLFRTVGYGHDALVWKEIISALRLVGYDGSISIEHEDAFMSIEEGLEKAITFLAPLLIREKPIDVFWA